MENVRRRLAALAAVSALLAAPGGAQVRRAVAPEEPESTGRVLELGTGLPVAGIEVVLEIGSAELDRTTTDAEGRFVFVPRGRTLHTRSVRVPHQPGWRISRPTYVPEGEDLLFRVRAVPTARAKGVVRDARGAPAPWFRFELIEEGGPRERLVCDADGRFETLREYAAVELGVSTANPDWCGFFPPDLRARHVHGETLVVVAPEAGPAFALELPDDFDGKTLDVWLAEATGGPLAVLHPFADGVRSLAAGGVRLDPVPHTRLDGPLRGGEADTLFFCARDGSGWAAVRLDASLRDGGRVTVPPLHPSGALDVRLPRMESFASGTPHARRNGIVVRATPLAPVHGRPELVSHDTHGPDWLPPGRWRVEARHPWFDEPSTLEVTIRAGERTRAELPPFEGPRATARDANTGQ